MQDKVQVGKDVWIKPNNNCCVLTYGEEYWFVHHGGTVNATSWHEMTADYAFWQTGNCFPTREAAEAAIIKPVDYTPVTYEQWVNAGKSEVFTIDGAGTVYNFTPVGSSQAFYFEVHKLWLTEESAQAWLDNWKKSN